LILIGASLVSTSPFVDCYIGTQLDIDVSVLTAGDIVVVESDRRLRPEQSYVYIHALYGIWFEDGRIAVSVPPGTHCDVAKALPITARFDEEWLESLRGPINHVLKQAGLPQVRNAWDVRLFACNATSVKRWREGECLRLRDESIPPAEGLRLPTHCFPDGIVYGIVEADRVVSVAYAHRTGLMEEKIVDLGVETSEAYRRRGYAKTVVSAVTSHMTELGGEGLYKCNASNVASIATACSVGYELYGKAVVLAASASD
jgi:RimJ/RimL family protein N-acetyltransferase